MEEVMSLCTRNITHWRIIDAEGRLMDEQQVSPELLIN